MKCPKCSQTVETGASFCGNCGQPLKAASTFRRHFNNPATAAHPIAQITLAAAGAPGYAIATPARQDGEIKALASLLFGITGLIGCLFMAAVGLGLGLAGLVVGTVARSHYKRGLSMAGLIVSSLAILAGLGVWIHNIQNDPRFNPAASPVAHGPSTSPVVSTANATTPCYSTGFIDKLNVANDPDSCDVSAYNGRTLSTSTNAYKVYADKTEISTANDFMGVAKNALEKDVKNNLTGFVLDSQRVGTFAGSPAYIINASEKEQDIRVVEAAVLHRVDNGENVFILVHATSGPSADLDILEAQWQWK